MGSYKFKWPHASSGDVFVTGTFDNWSKSNKLEKQTFGGYEKTVEIPDTKEKILYKFVVNGEWRADARHTTETDSQGNVNNILDPDDITPSQSQSQPAFHSKSQSDTASSAISSVAPGASTLGMAGVVPLQERVTSSSPPGAFPETPSTEKEQSFGVNPIPATGGIGNPVQLAPGAQVPDPSTLTGNTLESTARTGQESYERSANLTGQFGRPPASSSGEASKLTGQFGRPPASSSPGGIIPESSLPMDSNLADISKENIGPTMSSAGPGSSTAALAGQQPIEPRGTPTIVKQSEGLSTIGAGAAAGIAGAGAVGAGAYAATQGDDKANSSQFSFGQDSPADSSKMTDLPDFEKERTKNIKLHDGTSASSGSGAVAGAAAGVAGAGALGAGAYAATQGGDKSSQFSFGQDPPADSSKKTALPDFEQERTKNIRLHDGTMSSAAPGSTTADLAGQQPLEPRGVPTIVSESQKEAGYGAEASANQEAVDEKKQVEEELTKNSKEEPTTSESGTPGKSENGIGAKAAAGVGAAGVAAAGAAVAANEIVKDKTGKDATSALPESTQQTINEKAKESSIPEQAGTSSADRQTTSTVPDEVTESQKLASQDPEAAANTEAVQEKSEVENELLSKVPESQATGEPAPTDSAAAATTAPVPTTTSSSGAPQLGDPTGGGLEPIKLDEKQTSVPGGLYNDYSKSAGTETDGLNATKDSVAEPPAQTAAKGLAEQSQEREQLDSRDVSPMGKPAGGQTQPIVTSGVEESKTPSKSTSATPASNTTKRQSVIEKLKSYPDNSPSKSTTSSASGASPSATPTSKKEKRRSFFGRIKDKLKQ